METKRYELIYFDTHIDERRGDLVSIELPKDIGFEVKRVFYIHGETNAMRGGHAHKKCKQVLICLSGHVIVYINGINEEGSIHYHLDESNEGLFIDTETFIDMYFPDDSILLVLASEPYNTEDYIYASKVS